MVLQEVVVHQVLVERQEQVEHQEVQVLQEVVVRQVLAEHQVQVVLQV